MRPKRGFRFFFRSAPGRIVFLYALISVVWIYCSDWLLWHALHDSPAMALMSMFKGWFFVLVTSALLYVLIRQDILRHIRNEATARLVFDKSPAGGFISTLEGRFQRVNGQAVKILGYSRESLVGKSFADITHPDDLDLSRKKFAQLISGEVESIILDKRYIHGDGHVLWGHVTVHVARDPKGRPLHVVAMLEDVTERIEAERMLRQREHDYRTLIETTGTGFTTLDGNGVVVTANDEFVRLAGRKNLKDVLGKNIMTFTAPHAVERNKAAFTACLEAGFIRNFEIDHIDEEGNVIPVELNASAVRDGSEVRVLALCRDISERRKAEQRLREAMNYVNKVIEASPIAILTFKETGENVSANAAAVNLIGGPSEVLRSHNFRTLKSWKDAGFIAVADKALVTMTEQSVESRLITSFGRDFWTLCRFVPFYVEKQLHLMVMMVNVTDRVKMEQELRDHRDHLQEEIARERAKLELAQRQLIQSEKMAMVGQLAAGVAHEINNPACYVLNNLEILSGYTDVMQQALVIYKRMATIIAEGKCESGGNIVIDLAEMQESHDLEALLADAVDLVRESLTGALRIKKIVSDLRTFAHSDDGKKERVELNGLIESSLDIVWNEIRYKAIVKKDYGRVPEIICLPQLIHQVFVNLLINAAQAIEGKGVVTLKTYLNDGFVCADVADSGCGMTEEVQRHLFEPFFTTKPVGKGTGLGLTLVYNIIKQHGGDIVVKSAPDIGSTFTVRLPVAGVTASGSAS